MGNKNVKNNREPASRLHRMSLGRELSRRRICPF
jgi:hypothetical protein